MARVTKSRLVFLAIIGMLMLSGNNNVVGCHDDLQRLITQCGAYIEKSKPKADPSQGCCNVVKNMDIFCVCQQLTKRVVHLLDLNKNI
ncbi:Bifunctional inhibitor/plant lipid transfer protein/seed storage helical domain [Spatholobus suberectus]|nr:Bifunctional inhibitor/plant lipid transfer protein/seed storage helical domain [Spatholobus suberectus]